MRHKIPLLIYLAMLYISCASPAAVWYADNDNASGMGDDTSRAADSINEDKG